MTFLIQFVKRLIFNKIKDHKLPVCTWHFDRIQWTTGDKMATFFTNYLITNILKSFVFPRHISIF